MNRVRELVQDVRMILQKVVSSSKFITYFQLLEAFKETGCPVCIRLEQGALRALDSLMYEQVSDPFTRARLLESHGFCNWHAWILPRIQNSGLGVALIYRHFLHKTLERLQAARQAMRPRGRWQRLWERLIGSREEPLPILAWRAKKARCPVCVSAHRSEEQDLKTILEFIGEAEFAKAFSGSSGLCLPHLYAAMALGRDHPNLPALLLSHEEHWQDLLWELEEFARKFDYRHADEAMGREGTSWHRALEVFVGRAAVFGPERGEPRVYKAPQSVTPGPTPTEGGPTRAVDVEHRGEIETARFENEKLRRRIEELLAHQSDDHRTRLTLEFQVLKLTSDMKAMAVDLAAAQGKPASPGATPGADDSGGQPSSEGGERAETD